MKTKLTILILLLYSISSFSSVNWYHSLDDAKKISRATNKLILVDFWAEWCGPCKKMDSDVWSKEDITEISTNFIPVKINLDSNKALANKYSVKAIPMILILDSFGEVIYKSLGYKDKKYIKKLLESFSVNTSYINPALEIYHKSKDNLNSNLRVAQKYQDVAFYLEKDAKKSFLQQSHFYFNNASKINKKNNKDISISEKIELLEYLNSSYYGRHKFVLKKIESGFKVEDDNNKPIYLFLLWYNNLQLENVDKSNKYLSELQSLSTNNKYVKLANNILKNTNS